MPVLTLLTNFKLERSKDPKAPTECIFASSWVYRRPLCTNEGRASLSILLLSIGIFSISASFSNANAMCLKPWPAKNFTIQAPEAHKEIKPQELNSLSKIKKRHKETSMHLRRNSCLSKKRKTEEKKTYKLLIHHSSSRNTKKSKYTCDDNPNPWNSICQQRSRKKWKKTTIHLKRNFL